MDSPHLRARRQFRALHASPGAFVIANVWDGASAQMLAALGFEALATSSAASAATLGRRDGQVTREEALAQSRVILEATPLPVSADLEQGFGDAPQVVMETIRLAAEVGLAGASIEDATGEDSSPIYDLGHATERIAAAVEAARTVSDGFVLTARAENYLHGRSDLDDTVERLQAYEKAGADVLFAPGLPDLDSVRKVCSALSKPVNFMVGIRGKSFTVGELEAAGVRRISLSTSLYRAALTGALTAAREIREKGSFGYLDQCIPSTEVAAYLARP